MKRIYLVGITFIFSITFLLEIQSQEYPQVGLPDGAFARLGKGGINVLRFSPDGSRLAVGTDVGVWVYDVSDATGTALPSKNYGQVSTLAFSPDGRILVSGGGSNPYINVWELDTGKIFRTLTVEGKFPTVTDLYFHDSFLISVRDHYEVTIWDRHTFQELLGLVVDDTINAVRFTDNETVIDRNNGKVIASGDSTGEIDIREAITGERIATLNGHKESTEKDIITLGITNDNKLLVSAGRDKTIQLWDIPNQTQLATIKRQKAWVTSIAFSEDRKILATGYASDVINLWNVNTRRKLRTLKGHNNTVNALTFAPESTPNYGACLASGSADGTIRFWDPKTGKELVTFTDGHTEWVKTVAFNNTDTQIVSAAYNGVIEKWNLQTKQREGIFNTPQFDDTESAVLSSDATRYAVSGRKGTQFAFEHDSWGYKSTGLFLKSFQLWNLTTEKKIPGPWHSLFVKIVGSVFSPDGKVFAYDKKKEIIIVDITTKSKLFQIDEREPFDRKLAFSPDGKLLAYTDKSDKAKVLVLDTQHEIVLPIEGRISIFAFSPDSSMLATKGKDIHLWQLDTSKQGETKKLTNNFFGLNNVMTFSPDGNTLVCYDLHMLKKRWLYGIKLIDVRTDKVLGILSGHTEPIETLVFSHNGKILASGSMDGTILLWDWIEIMSKLKEDG
ncbi:hypothetical protein JT359_19175 [Candidatus Poribacteria bacterium]|nr:hypothetical protein [Candidatus Poribacteria bacterium]